ncbi:hypothetical protein TNCV_282581 [Trichonephila clavipes]|nr:hypothetical protein TNCV_282581 [Trichonephila clavipes]
MNVLYLGNGYVELWAFFLKKDSTMSSLKWESVPRTYDPLKAGSIDGTDTVPHDHGIVRAMQAEYKPNKLVVGDPKATIFVGRLNPITEENALKKVFSSFGDIKRLRLVRDIVTGFSKGYAFIEYYDKYDAARAVREADIVIDDKEVLVDIECERLLKGWIPRRLGEPPPLARITLVGDVFHTYVLPPPRYFRSRDQTSRKHVTKRQSGLIVNRPFSDQYPKGDETIYLFW